MKITISINGRFHAFDLAREMYKRGYLRKLITTYPKQKTEEWDIPGHLVVSIWPLEVLKRLQKKVSGNFFKKNFTLYEKQVFDIMTSFLMSKDSDIFIGWSSNSLRTISECKKNNIFTILERGSAHIQEQIELLAEEHRINKLSYLKHHEKITKRELFEYEITDIIEVPSTYAYKSFLDKGVSQRKMIKGFRGVDLSAFKKVKKQCDTFRVVYAGQLSLQKGSHYLLQAINELRSYGIELWHMGTVTREMNQFVEKYRCEQIKLLGPKPQQELFKYYSQGSVFVLPSIQDGFGMVIPQAMACELPVICTTNTGGPDLIIDGKEGFIIPIRDVRALKEKIVYLHDNPQICQKMGVAAKQKVSKGFTWNDYGDQITAIYREKLEEYRIKQGLV